MKKATMIFVLFLFAISTVFALQNTFLLSSEEVKTFLLLRKASSSNTPDPVYPVSGSQLVILLESLDTSGLNEQELRVYHNLIDSIQNRETIIKGKQSSFNLSASVLGFQKYNNLNLNSINILPFKDFFPMFELTGEVYYSDYAYGVFDFNCLPSYLVIKDKPDFSYSIFDLPTFANSFPDRGFLSLGYKSLSFIIGRDRLGAGNGYTGNLLLGENAFYEDFAKLSFISDKFSYDFALSSFEQEKDTFLTQERNKKSIFIHRASFDLFDKVSITAFEGALMYGKTPFTDLRLFNPLMILHQTFMFEDGNQNNFFGAEVSAQLPLNIQLSGQVFIDQLVIESEVPESTGDSSYMVLGNLSKTVSFAGGFLDIYAEGVYGNPYVYLKNAHGYGIDTLTGILLDGSGIAMKDYCHHVDLILEPYAVFNNANTQDRQYMGYKYGGDLWSAAIGASYLKKNLNLSLNLQYLSKGIYGIREGEQRFCQGFDGDANIHMNSFIAQAKVDLTVLKGIKIDARAAFIDSFNFGHEKGCRKNAFQYSFGINVNLIDLAKAIF